MSPSLATGVGGSLPESAILAVPDSPGAPGKIPQTTMRSHFAHGSQKAVDLKGKTLKPGDFTPETKLNPLFLKNLLRIRGNFGVHPRQNSRQIFQDGHLRTKAPPYRSQFQTNKSGADHNQTFGNFRKA